MPYGEDEEEELLLQHAVRHDEDEEEELLLLLHELTINLGREDGMRRSYRAARRG